ncbi:MAG: hypothetical protein PWP76_392 [Candidatus Diapherotrites archaeon]|nr:hypothetical protein [Candidatus Diapherotrites archaeon]
MKSLGEYWRLSEKDRELIEMLRRGDPERKIRKALGLTHRQIKHKVAKLKRLGKI